MGLFFASFLSLFLASALKAFSPPPLRFFSLGQGGGACLKAFLLLLPSLGDKSCFSRVLGEEGKGSESKEGDDDNVWNKRSPPPSLLIVKWRGLLRANR